MSLFHSNNQHFTIIFSYVHLLVYWTLNYNFLFCGAVSQSNYIRNYIFKIITFPFHENSSENYLVQLNHFLLLIKIILIKARLKAFGLGHGSRVCVHSQNVSRVVFNAWSSGWLLCPGLHQQNPALFFRLDQELQVPGTGSHRRTLRTHRVRIAEEEYSKVLFVLGRSPALLHKRQYYPQGSWSLLILSMLGNI